METVEAVPEWKIVAELMKMLADADCVWNTIQFMGIRTMKFKTGEHETYWVKGKTEEGQRYAALLPVGTTELVLVKIEEREK